MLYLNASRAPACIWLRSNVASWSLDIPALSSLRRIRMAMALLLARDQSDEEATMVVTTNSRSF